MNEDDTYSKIPDELKEIINSFEQSSYDEEGILYHYTDFNKLKSIIKTNELWLTDHRYLNDTSEINYGLWWLAKNIFNGKDFEEHKKEFIFRQKYVLNNYPFFTTSFCEAKNYLPSWRLYANDGSGVCIGFDAEKIRDSFYRKKKTNEINNESILTGINYIESSDNIGDKWIDQVHDYYKTRVKDIPSKDHAIFCLALRSLFPQIKHSCFQEEREVRLAISNFDYHAISKEPFKIHYRHADPKKPFHNSKAYIKYPIQLDWIKEVWAGPCVHQEHFEQEINTMLLEKRLEHARAINTYYSELPYKRFLDRFHNGIQ